MSHATPTIADGPDRWPTQLYLGCMPWGTLLAAALGAVFGVGSTLLTDVIRSRREDERRWADTKRVVYVRFLVALAQAHSRMVVTAFSGIAADDRRNAVHRAFHDDPQHSPAKSVLRELGVTAPPAVYGRGLLVYELLREARELLAQASTTLETPTYQAVITEFFRSLEELQGVMREDLQPHRSRRFNGLGLESTRARATRPVE